MELINVFVKFLYAPVLFPQVIWSIVPVLISIILMELYFRRYPREGLGHHKSLENTIFLVFICFELSSFLFKNYTLARLVLLILFIVFVAIISMLDFFHKLPVRLIFRTSSKFLIAFTTYVVIVLMFSDALTGLTFIRFLEIMLSIFVILLFLFIFKQVFKSIEPKSYDDIERYLNTITEDIKKTHEDVDIDLKKKSGKKKPVKKTTNKK
ncbi:MAG: hypothetical protein NDI94_05015 [Candidatus Woesearchaeota archaeon]|nr:hypothetical protein [Candidatus Woesearchaeota archaeon]